MDKRKQTPSDRRGNRLKRRPRDPSAEREDELEERQESSWRPSDDIYGNDRRMSKNIDADFDPEGRFSQRPPRH